MVNLIPMDMANTGRVRRVLARHLWEYRSAMRWCLRRTHDKQDVSYLLAYGQYVAVKKMVRSLKELGLI